jgi:hypothetical protein
MIEESSSDQRSLREGQMNNRRLPHISSSSATQRSHPDHSITLYANVYSSESFVWCRRENVANIGHP